jgi:hypothetical protein
MADHLLCITVLLNSPLLKHSSLNFKVTQYDVRLNVHLFFKTVSDFTLFTQRRHHVQNLHSMIITCKNVCGIASLKKDHAISGGGASKKLPTPSHPSL